MRIKFSLFWQELRILFQILILSLAQKNSIKVKSVIQDLLRCKWVMNLAFAPYSPFLHHKAPVSSYHTTFAINVIVMCLSFGKIRYFSYSWKLTYLNSVSQRVMEWFGLEGAKRSSLCMFGNQGVLSLWIFLPLFYMIFGKAVLCYHHAKVRFSNTFKLSGAKVSLGINPLAAIDLHQRGILACSW